MASQPDRRLPIHIQDVADVFCHSTGRSSVMPKTLLQLGRISTRDFDQIAFFLKSGTGRYKRVLVANPPVPDRGTSSNPEG